MRTEEDFQKVLKDATWLANFHNKIYYISVVEGDYSVSCYKPSDHHLDDNTGILEVEPTNSKELP